MKLIEAFRREFSYAAPLFRILLFLASIAFFVSDAAEGKFIWATLDFLMAAWWGHRFLESEKDVL